MNDDFEKKNKIQIYLQLQFFFSSATSILVHNIFFSPDCIAITFHFFNFSFVLKFILFNFRYFVFHRYQIDLNRTIRINQFKWFFS